MPYEYVSSYTFGITLIFPKTYWRTEPQCAHPKFLTEALVFCDGGMCRKKNDSVSDEGVAYLIALPMTLVATFHRFKMIQKYPWLHNKSKHSAANTQPKKNICVLLSLLSLACRAAVTVWTWRANMNLYFGCHRSTQLATLSPSVTLSTLTQLCGGKKTFTFQKLYRDKQW